MFPSLWDFARKDTRVHFTCKQRLAQKKSLEISDFFFSLSRLALRVFSLKCQKHNEDLFFSLRKKNLYMNSHSDQQHERGFRRFGAFLRFRFLAKMSIKKKSCSPLRHFSIFFFFFVDTERRGKAFISAQQVAQILLVWSGDSF